MTDKNKTEQKTNCKRSDEASVKPEVGRDEVCPRRDCSNLIKPENWSVKEGDQKKVQTKGAVVFPRPLASRKSGQALDQQVLGQ